MRRLYVWSISLALLLTSFSCVTAADPVDQTSPARLNSLTFQTILGIQDMADIVSERFGCCPWNCGNAMEVNQFRNQSVWVNYEFSWADDDSEGSHLGYNANSSAVILGFERRWCGAMAGLAVSYANHDLTWLNSEGDADANVPFLTAYAGKALGNWRVGGELGTGFFHNSADREIPDISESLQGGYSGNGILAEVNACTTYVTGNWTLAPSAGLQYINVWEDSYEEAGGVTALHINSRAVDVLRSDLGFCAQYNYRTKNDRQIGQAFRVRWLEPLTDRTKTIDSSFVTDPSSSIVGSDFAVPGSMLEAGIATSVQVAENQCVQFSYNFRDELNGTLTMQDVELQYSVGF